MLNEARSPSVPLSTGNDEPLPLDMDTFARVPWHAIPSQRAVELTGTSDILGLSDEDVAQRRLVFGPNTIESRQRFVWLKRLWRQINNILIYILFVSMIVSYVLQKYTDASVIAVVLVFNISIGMVMESRAEKASEAIRRMLPSTCVVRRNGQQLAIQTADLVPGDLVVLNAGDKISADLRLVKCSSFKTQEAVLTGESVPVEKTTAPVDAVSPLGDRFCMVFSGTLVAAGSATGLVVSTGMRTEVGKISKLVQDVTNEGTPLLHKIERFGRILSIGILVLAIIVFTIVAVRSTRRGIPTSTALTDAFMVAVSLAVAAVPEGLPAIVTIVLSRAVRSMAHQNAIVRQLAAVETLGSVTTICSDKTGTLTQNEMTAVVAATPSGEYCVDGTGYKPTGSVYRVTRLEEAAEESAAAAVRSQASLARRSGRVDGGNVSEVTGREGHDHENADDADDDDEDDEATELSPELSAVPVLAQGGGGPGSAPATPSHVRVTIENGLLHRHLAQCCALCNDAEIHLRGTHWELVGDPTEGALATFASKLQLSVTEVRQAMPRRDVVPFESAHRFMATLHVASHGDEDERLLYIKGAPEAILRLARTQFCGSATEEEEAREPLDRARWVTAAERMARLGLRAIALAYARVPRRMNVALSVDNVVDLDVCFLGIVGIVDPPRPEAIMAVGEFHRAGIVVKMITGDHPETARQIAGQLLISNERVLTGAQVDAMTDEQLRKDVLDVCVFARSSPENKIRIVKALQDCGQVVSMTGDGVNDAPSLRQADIGVAMGVAGSESAKEASAVVLADDNFATIAHAVREGRVVFDNLRKTLRFLLPVNVGLTLVILLAVIADRTLPISPAQVLWINMITSIALGSSLAFEPEEGDVMRRKPRKPNKSLWEPRLIWRMVFIGFSLGGLCLLLFEWELQFQQSVQVARAATVTLFASGQAFYLLSSRFLSKPSLSLRMFRKRNYVLLASIAALAVLQVIFVYVPFMRVLFDTDGPEPMQAWAWLRALAFGVVIFLLAETEKLVMRQYHRFRSRRRAARAAAARADLEMAPASRAQALASTAAQSDGP